METRDDDAFWAARRVAAFTDDLIRAAVHTGQFSDPAAEKHLGDVLIKRRDKIAQRLSDGGEPDRQSAPRRERPPDVRERGRRGRRRARAPVDVSRVVDALRQRDRRRPSRCRQRRARRRRSQAPAGLPTAPAATSRWISRRTARRTRRGSSRSRRTSAGRRRAGSWSGSERLPETVPAAQTLQRRRTPNPKLRRSHGTFGSGRNERDRRPPERDLLAGRVEHRDLTVVSSRRQALERHAEPQRHRLRSRIEPVGHRQRRASRTPSRRRDRT